MLNLPLGRIYFYHGHADMRKSYDGLYKLVVEHFPSVDLSGSLFVFINKRKTQVKALYWDEDGFALWSKRLRQGCFKKPTHANPQLSRRELNLLLEGVEPKRMNKRFSLKN